jgi:hypothetical protein
MGRNIEGRIAELEDSTPRGYTTYDDQGRVVIQSALPPGEWYRWATGVLQGRRGTARTQLLDQLARSARSAGGGLLHEYLLAMYQPLAEEERKCR